MQNTPLKTLTVLVLFGALLPASVALVNAQQRGKPKFNTWRQYLGASDSSQYSSLDQINKSNVAKLEVAWTFPTGDMRTYRFNPIVVDGVMYVLARNLSVVALDAATGKEIWTHENQGAIGDRGMNYWESADRKDRRLLYVNAGFLTAIDAATGKTIESFGDKGKVDLRLGLNRDVTNVRPLQTGNPGRIFENLIIISLPAGGAQYISNPGDTHAYDVRTGKLVWTFHSVPEKGEFGADTWPEAALASGGGVHNWSELTVDEARGIAYIPFGTARFDFYGGNRIGNNLFGNSIVALDARTGKRLWHFQAVHHDLWDYDFPQAPKILTVRNDGRNVDIIAQASKQGLLYVFDRVTGKPLWPIEEKPVPQTDVPGEKTSPTQPIPTLPPPFARQSFTEKDINPYLTAEEQAALRENLKKWRNEGVFTPPSLQGSIEMPGHNGGANWGSSAINPAKGTFFIVSKELPTLMAIVPPGTPTGRGRAGGARSAGPADLKARGCAAARRRAPPPTRRHSRRAGRVRRVQLAVQLHERLRERHVRHRTAVVAADGVRPEHRQDPVAGAERRDAGAVRAARPKPAATRRAAASRRRPAACSSSAHHPIARCAPTIRTRARCCGRWTSRRPSKACRPSTKSGGREYIVFCVGGGRGLFAPREGTGIAAAPGPAQYMAFALPKR